MVVKRGVVRSHQVLNADTFNYIYIGNFLKHLRRDNVFSYKTKKIILL